MSVARPNLQGHNILEGMVAIRADVALPVKNGRILGVDFLGVASVPDSFVPDKQTDRQS